MAEVSQGPSEAKAKVAKGPAKAEAKPPEGSIAAALAGIRNRLPSEDVDSYTAELATISHKTQISANLTRIKMVSELKQPKREAGKDNVKEWQQAQAKRLGIEARMFRYVLSAAKALRQLATELPIDFLDRPMAKVARDAKVTATGGDPDAAKVKNPPVAKPGAQVVDKHIKGILGVLSAVPDDQREELIVKIRELLEALAD